MTSGHLLQLPRTRPSHFKVLLAFSAPLTFASRLGGPCLPLTRAASMLCGWLSSSVARLVVNTVPPTFSSTRSGKQLVTGGGAAWRPLVEGCCWGGGPAAAAGALVARRGTLRGGLLLAFPPASCCPHAAAGSSPPPVRLTAPDMGRGRDEYGTRV